MVSIHKSWSWRSRWKRERWDSIDEGETRTLSRLEVSRYKQVCGADLILWVLGGLSDPGEHIQDAVIREVFEETGVETVFSGILTFRSVNDFFKYQTKSLDIQRLDFIQTQEIFTLYAIWNQKTKLKLKLNLANMRQPMQLGLQGTLSIYRVCFNLKPFLEMQLRICPQTKYMRSITQFLNVWINWKNPDDVDVMLRNSTLNEWDSNLGICIISIRIIVCLTWNKKLWMQISHARKTSLFFSWYASRLEKVVA